MRSLKTTKYLLVAILALLLGMCPVTMTTYGGENNQQYQNGWRLPFFKEKSLWHAMSGQFRLLGYTNQPAVQREILWFSRERVYIHELTRNARMYIYYVYQQALKRHMPAEVALVPMIESNYKPFNYSRTGAIGLWQMMPGTASGFGLKINWWYDGRRDVIGSTRAALDYLKYLHSYFGSWLLAMAAYDSGEGTVLQAIHYNRRHGRPTDYWSLPLPLETKNYVPKVLALAAIIHDPARYGLRLDPVPNTPYFTVIQMHRQMDLAKIAKLASTSRKIVRQLNPGFRRWATVPHEAYQLVLPIDNAKLFTMRLAELNSKHVSWMHHKVVAGDSLSKIASRYHTSSRIIKVVNRLKSDVLHIGQNLLIPESLHGNYRHFISHEHASITEDQIPGPKRVLYTVKARDSLWRIAARYHVTSNQIRYWNGLHNRHPLHTGQQIVIWKRHHHIPRAYARYRVRPGDSLSRIAVRFHTKTSALKAYNHLASDTIRVGQYLKIPKSLKHKHYHARAHNLLVVHRVRAGESLNDIAKYYRVSLAHLKKWNHLSHTRYLRLGQRIKIYLAR